MTVSIEVEDEAWQALAGLDQLVQSAVVSALRGAGADPGESEIAILFTGDQSIAAINAEWRGMNKPTHGLSCPAAPG